MTVTGTFEGIGLLIVILYLQLNKVVRKVLMISTLFNVKFDPTVAEHITSHL
jgi:hypothetical protein